MALRTRTRLTAVALAALVVLGLVGISVVRADPSPSLPSVAADALLGSSLAALARPFSVSGEVITRVDLGLPELPGNLAGGTGGSVPSLLGTQRFKVWHGPEGLRVAHLTDLGEQTLVADRTEAWWWNSDGMTAEHIVYADVARSVAGPWFAAMAPRGEAPADPQVPAGDPIALAGRALSMLAPYAGVSVDGTALVAGRPAYDLVLSPRSTRTLIGSVRVAIDAQTRLPLRLEVTPTGATAPAIEAGFTSVSLDAIDPSTFTFSPPAGATVTTPVTGDLPGMPTADHAAEPRTRTFGTGFDTRVAVRLEGPPPPETAAILPYAGPLASVLSVETGGHTWILFGFVSLDTLRKDATHLA